LTNQVVGFVIFTCAKILIEYKACFSNVIFDIFKQNELKDKASLNENKVDTETLPGKLSTCS
jgi:hypothetical protein